MAANILLPGWKALSLRVDGEWMDEKGMISCTRPDRENPFWRLEWNDGTVVVASGNVAVEMKPVVEKEEQK